MAKDLLSDFENATEKQWLSKILNDLKGKPLSSLNWDSEIGVINPVIFSSDNCTTDNFKTRKNNNWEIRQSFDANNFDANRNILEALKGGCNAIEIKNLSTANIESTLSNVTLSIISVYVDINTKTPLEIIELFKNYCTKNKYDTATLTGGFKYDVIGNLTASGNWLNSEENDLSSILQVIEAFKKFPNFSILNVNAYNYSESGANIDTQLAYALSHANEYLNLFKENPEQLKIVINKLEFAFGIGTSYFLEIAKLRAFRSLWTAIVKKYLPSIKGIETKIHAINSNLYYSNKDSYNNLLRATTCGMSAVIGGVNSLTLLPFSVNTSENDSFAQRISTNIQLLLQEESYFNQVINASKGAHYIEKIIEKIKTNSWALFLEIEKEGGFIEALKSEEIQKRIESEYLVKSNALKEETAVMIGVNRFIDEVEEYSVSHKEAKTRNNTTCKSLTFNRLAFEYE